MREEGAAAAALPGMTEDEVDREAGFGEVVCLEGGGWGACRERRRECLTAVSLDFCSTHQNSAACRHRAGGEGSH